MISSSRNEHAALLVDTHIFLWLRTTPAVLTAGERTLLDEAGSLFVSIVTIWEIAILMTLSRIGRNETLLRVPNGFELLPLQLEHCREVIDLPRHHRDPFDRMLIAQARFEKLPLLTRDRAIANYADAGLIVLTRR